MSLWIIFAVGQVTGIVLFVMFCLIALHLESFLDYVELFIKRPSRLAERIKRVEERNQELSEDLWELQREFKKQKENSK